MNWRCLFSQCEWVWLFNGELPQSRKYTRPAPVCGVYQCSKCKTVSIGAARYVGWEHGHD